jgi:aspartyl/asparaginyl beta-hydroxylase (cupin superfamily)
MSADYRVGRVEAGPTDTSEAELHRLKERTMSEPRNTALWFSLSQQLRGLGRYDEAIAAVEHVLALQPHNLEALFLAASIQEARGAARVAAATYRTALAHVRQGAAVMVDQRAAIDRAKAAVAANDDALDRYLEERLEGLRAEFSSEPLDRFDRCMATLLRKRRVFRPMPSFLYFPNIPSIEFFERDDFPWLAEIEAGTDDIRAELVDVLRDAPGSLEPYITTKQTPGVTPQKDAGGGIWRELNDSPRWSSYFFWQEGRPYPENIARCPKTVAALNAWPRCDLPRTGPTAMFSLLAPKTRIPPHTGVTNARIVVHIPLIVPPDCGFRVGAETREWELGKALVFDDTIEHEAWNNSDRLRAVLIIDIWNPFLTLAEREMVRSLTDGVGEFYGELPAYV